MANNIHRILKFGNNIPCPSGIDISRKYELGLDYVHEILNDLKRNVQKDKHESNVIYPMHQ